MALSPTMQLLILAAYIVFLYYITLPGVLITLPSATDSKMVVNLTHSVVFATVFILTQEMFVKQIARF